MENMNGATKVAETTTPTSTRLDEIQKMTTEGKVARDARREARRIRMEERAERMEQARADRFDRRVMRTSDFILKMIKRRAAAGKNTYTYKAGLRSRRLRRLLNEVMAELPEFNPRFRGKVIRRWYYGWYDSYTVKERHARLDFSW